MVRARHVADVWVSVDDLGAASLTGRATLVYTPSPVALSGLQDSAPLATTKVVIEDQDGHWFCFATAHLP